MTGLPTLARELRRAVARRRWLLAAGLAAAAVATALPTLAPVPQATTTLLAAARDLAAGTTLTEADLTEVSMSSNAVPSGALRAGDRLAGRLVAGAVRKGEPLTDVRLLGPGLLSLSGTADVVAVPVRLADPATGRLLRPGDHIDVLAASTQPDGPSSAVIVAADAAILTVPPAETGGEGALVVLATSPATAARLASAAVSSRLSFVLRR